MPTPTITTIPMPIAAAAVLLAALFSTYLFDPSRKSEVVETEPSTMRKNSRPLEGIAPVAKAEFLKTKISGAAMQNPQARRQTELAEMATDLGFEKATDQVRRNFVGNRAGQRAGMESLLVTWANEDPVAASQWLAKNTGENGQTDGMLATDLWEAALGGYIEGIASSDAETAVLLADLLVPQTRLPASNPQNRSTSPSISPGVGTPVLDEVPPSPTSEIAEQPPEQDLPESPGEPQELERRPFPGDPGFPGDPDFLAPDSHDGS